MILFNGASLKINKPNRDLRHLFYSTISRKTASILLWIYSPLYIYSKFEAEKSTQTALILVSIYFLLSFIAKLIFFMWAENLSQRLGFKGLIKLSSVPFFLFIVSLLLIPYFKFALIFSAIFWGAEIAFFWWGYHGYFVKTGNSAHFGENIGEIGLFETLTGIITPLMGAVIVTYLGFNYLFVTAFIFLLAALVLLGKNHDKKQKRDIHINEVIRLIVKHKSKSLAYAGSSAEGSLYAIFWPIFLFVVVGGYLKLGSIVALSGFIAALFAIAVGRWTDNKGTNNIIVIGSPLVTSAWIIRYLSKTPAFFVLADAIGRFGGSMVGLPLSVLTYKKALDGRGLASAILFREMALSFGSILALVSAVFLFMFGFKLEYLFLLGAVFSIFPLISSLRGGLDFKDE